MKTNIPKLDTSKIVQVRLKETQYYQEEFPKKQIVLHHTVSNGNAKNVMAWWAKTQEKIGTAFIIDREGIIHQCFSSRHWAHHLGTKGKNNKQLNQHSIGIELCSWGGLFKKKSSFFSVTGIKIKNADIFNLDKNWRGFQYFQKYSEKQLTSLLILTNYLCDIYKIPKIYNPDIWDISNQALDGESGVYTHVSYRKDKSDCFPQKELIKVLKQLENN